MASDSWGYYKAGAAGPGVGRIQIRTVRPPQLRPGVAIAETADGDADGAADGEAVGEAAGDADGEATGEGLGVALGSGGAPGALAGRVIKSAPQGSKVPDLRLPVPPSPGKARVKRPVLLKSAFRRSGRIRYMLWRAKLRVSSKDSSLKNAS